MEIPGFVFGSNPSRARTADVERTINWYPEPMQSPGAPTRATLYPTPGVVQVYDGIAAGLGGQGRAHFFENGREFAVIGTVFGELDQAGAFTSRGTVTDDGVPATISSNGDGGGELFITAGGNAYLFTLSTNAFAAVTDLATVTCTMGDFLDGYFLCFDATTSKLYLSALFDGSSWTIGTDFAQRSVKSDPWVAMKVFGRYVWLLGEHTSEAWYNSGGSFALSFHPSSPARYGCASPWSIAKSEDSLLWVGKNEYGQGLVIRAQGFQPQVISSFSVNQSLEDVGSLAAVRGDIYQEEGHTFYLIYGGSTGTAWVFDLTTSIWHERGVWDSAQSIWTPQRTLWHAFAFNEHRWLDWGAPDVYRTSKTTYTDILVGGTATEIRRLRRAHALENENKRVFYKEFQVDLEAGQAVGHTGQGSNPHMMMRFSDDAGWTWSTERFGAAGKVGEYGARMHWHRLGAGRRRVFEVSVTDPIPWRLTNAYADVAPGAY